MIQNCFVKPLLGYIKYVSLDFTCNPKENGKQIKKDVISGVDYLITSIIY